MLPKSQPRRLFVFCDGTWCGPETKTRTNVQVLAEMIGINVSGGQFETEDKESNYKGRYFYGIGLGSSFLGYLFNGSTGNDISVMCIETYQWIADNFTHGTEIWMFGLSRGAYTVRCVSGMINNCGIIRHPTRTLCNEVYAIYSSPYDEDKPTSEQSTTFRQNASWDDAVPVKFLGLFDTVGSIGIPTIDKGKVNGPQYPTLWDQVVPSVVDTVYHAVSLDDRLSVFQPCLTKLSTKEQKARKPPKIFEQWFPGCHYDLGRQRFKFLPQKVRGLEQLLFYIPNLLSGTLEPNGVLSDLVLQFMLMGIQKTEPEQTFIRNIGEHISNLTNSIETVRNGVGSGDVYSNKWVAYAPFGRILALFPTPGIITETIRVLIAIRDRRIPDDQAEIYQYYAPYLTGSKSIAQLADLTTKRYPSRTHLAYEEWRAYFKH